MHDAVHLMARPALAMIETPQGVLTPPPSRRSPPGWSPAPTISPRCWAFRPGREDRLAHALQRIVLAARAAGVAAFDGVYNGLEADEALAAECAEGRAYGFDGKSAIHPSQIDAINRAFSPDEAAIEAARRCRRRLGRSGRHEGG